MSRFLAVALAASAVLAFSSPARAESYFGFNIGISNAPPPPRVVYVREPRTYYVPERRVYVVQDDDYDYDLFRYGNAWFAYDNGYWYRASARRGRYVAIDVRRVPRSILELPAERWRHHPHGGPPGQMKKRYVSDNRYDHRGDWRDDDRGRDRGRGDKRYKRGH